MTTSQTALNHASIKQKQRPPSSLLDKYASVLVFLLVLVMLVMLRMDDAMMQYEYRVLLTLHQRIQDHQSSATRLMNVTTIAGKMVNEHKQSVCDVMMGTKMKDSFYICKPYHVFNNNDNHNIPMSAIQQLSQLKCQWNPLLRSSFCEAHNLIVDPSKVTILANGGEDIAQVQGRKEEDEFPIYQPGAFQLDGRNDCSTSMDDPTTLRPSHETLPNHLQTIMNNVISSHQHDTAPNNIHHHDNHQQQQCDIIVEQPTLFVTRYEYANLYHTYTDWYSAYQAVMVALDGDRAAVDTVDIVFLDGHARGSVDQGWKLLFPHATISFVSELRRTKRSCYRHAIFAPPGYRAPISMEALEDRTTSPQIYGYIQDCTNTEWQADFRERMVGQALKQVQSTTKVTIALPPTRETGRSSYRIKSGDREDPVHSIKVLIVSRRDYTSHPRMNGQVTRQIANENELLAVMEQLTHVDIGAQQHKLTIQTATIALEKHSVAEQILAFQQADIVLGMHGAGLSHILVARPGTILLEIKPPGFTIQRHFEYLAGLAGCLYQPHIPDLAPLKNRHMPYTIPMRRFQMGFYQSVQAYLIFHGA